MLVSFLTFTDCCQERLKNFLLTVYPVNDSYIPVEHRGSNTVKNTYSVVPTPRISFPVTQVKITQGFNRERFLTLCEVLAFGGEQNRCCFYLCIPEKKIKKRYNDFYNLQIINTEFKCHYFIFTYS